MSKKIVFIMVVFIVLGCAWSVVAQQRLAVGSISGKVNDASTKEPIQGVHIFFAENVSGTFTDPTGEFFIKNLLPGKYTIRAKVVGYPEVDSTIFVIAGKMIQVDFNLSSKPIELKNKVLPPGVGEISGIITDKETGDSLPGAAVLVVGTNKGASTGAKGEYTISNLAPGEYKVRAVYLGYAAVEADVSVVDGVVTPMNFIMESAAIDLGKVITIIDVDNVNAIMGKVANKDTGKPIAGAIVCLLYNKTVATTDENGAYSILYPSPGKYTVVITKTGFMAAEHTVRVKEGPVFWNFFLKPIR